MFNVNFHAIFVLTVMIVIPIICTLIEFFGKKDGFFNLLLKWVIFWTIGIRALTAGFMQFTNPQYTMGLLSLPVESTIIVRELGFLQFGVGLAAILSMFKKSYLEPVLICHGIFMVGASYLHISRASHIDFGELVSLLGDLLVVTIVIIYFIKVLLNIKSRTKNECKKS